MAGYVPWHGKKRAALACREGDLLRYLRHADQVGANRAEGVIEAAEEVRASKIRLLKSERSRIDRGDGTHADHLRRLDEQIQSWRRMPIGEIIDEYRSRLNEAASADDSE